MFYVDYISWQKSSRICAPACPFPTLCLVMSHWWLENGCHGVLTPQKLPNFTNQGLVPLERQLLNIYQNTPGHTQVWQPLIEWEENGFRSAVVLTSCVTWGVSNFLWAKISLALDWGWFSLSPSLALPVPAWAQLKGRENEGKAIITVVVI